MKRSSEGFALVEAVVALGIVAAILGITFEAVAAGRRAMASAEERRTAMLQAQSLQSQLGATIPLVAGTSSGQSGDFDWRVEISPKSSREIGTPMLHSVVIITDRRNRILARLETLRLAR